MQVQKQTRQHQRTLSRLALVPAVVAAARINDQEVTVHQINLVLERQQGLKPEQADAASRQILEIRIAQEVAVQMAE